MLLSKFDQTLAKLWHIFSNYSDLNMVKHFFVFWGKAKSSNEIQPGQSFLSCSQGALCNIQIYGCILGQKCVIFWRPRWNDEFPNMFCTKIASFCWLNYEITSSAYICSLTHIMYLKESNVLHALGECRISYNPVDCSSIKIHKMHMLYVYKMLFRGSFYKELDWPSIKCPSRAPYLIIL